MEKQFLEYINTISKWIIGKNISYSAYEWTKENSIFCQIGIGEYNVYLEIFLDKGRKEIETITNVYKNKEQQLAYGGQINECLEQIAQLIKI
jgi:hypothetical protein